MSSHADTIRDYTTNTERYDGQWHRLPTEQEVLAALDAFLAENQRLREALIAMRELESVNEDTWYGEHAGIDRHAVYALAREALAGDENKEDLPDPSNVETRGGWRRAGDTE